MEKDLLEMDRHSLRQQLFYQDQQLQVKHNENQILSS